MAFHIGVTLVSTKRKVSFQKNISENNGTMVHKSNLVFTSLPSQDLFSIASDPLNFSDLF